MINIALDAGSGRAGKVISPLMKKINDELDLVFDQYICSTYEDISIVLYVSGNVHDFKFSGGEKPKLNKKEKSVEVDIGIREQDWLDVSTSKIMNLMSKYLCEAIVSSYDLLHENGVDVDKEVITAKLDSFQSNILKT